MYMREARGRGQAVAVEAKTTKYGLAPEPRSIDSRGHLSTLRNKCLLLTSLCGINVTHLMIIYLSIMLPILLFIFHMSIL